MKRMFSKKYFLVFILLALFLGMGDYTYAQKKKSKSSKKELPESIRFETEKLFAEANKYFILEDFAKSYQLFVKALELDPENAAINYKIAEILSKGDDLDRALIHITKSLEVDKSNKYYYLLAAQIYTQQSNFKEATRIYEDLVKSIPGTEQYYFDLAAIYLYQRDYEAALNTYEKAEAYYGKIDDIVFQKQQIYLKQNKLDEAIREGIEMVRLNPGEILYVLRLSEILIANGKSSEAIPYITELLNENPNEGRARILLYEIYKTEGNEELALENLKIAFQQEDLNLDVKMKYVVDYVQIPDPEKKDLILNLAKVLVDTHPQNSKSLALYGDVYFQYGDKEQAKNQYLNSLQLDGSNFNIWQNVIQIEAELNQMDSVQKHAQRALEFFPNQGSLYYYLGTSNLILNDYPGAIDAFEQGKKLSSTNLPLLGFINGQLGDTYNSVQEYEKSDKAYEEALNIDPNNDHVLNNYSYFLSLRQEKLELARKMSTKLVKRNPENPTFLDTHAWVLYQIGDYDESLKYMEKALDYGEAKGTLLEHYGDILFKLGKVDEAVTQWKKAKGMDDSSELIDKKIADRKLYEK